MTIKSRSNAGQGALSPAGGAAAEQRPSGLLIGRRTARAHQKKVRCVEVEENFGDNMPHNWFVEVRVRNSQFRWVFCFLLMLLAAPAAAASNILAATPSTAPDHASQAILANMSSGDIEALAFLVLMEASKSDQEDVAAIMAATKAINNTKQMLRQLLGERATAEGELTNAYAVAGGEPPIGNEASALLAELQADAQLKFPPSRFVLKAQLLKLVKPLPRSDQTALLQAISDWALSREASLENLNQVDQAFLPQIMTRKSQLLQMIANLAEAAQGAESTVAETLKSGADAPPTTTGAASLGSSSGGTASHRPCLFHGC